MDEESLRVELARLSDWLIPGSTPWAVAAGSAVYLYTGNRVPMDLDVLVRPEDLDAVAGMIGYQLETESTSWGEVTKIRVGPAEIAGRLVVKTASNSYPYFLDSDMVAHVRFITYHGIRVPVLSPEDLVALKAVLQRGPDQGKHDLEDIQALVASTPLDPTYLRVRLERMGAEERARQVLGDGNWAATT